MSIYTRTGDKGKTSLFDGTRVLKSDLRVETYGTVDELNSAIGAAVAQLKTKNPPKARLAKGGLELKKLKKELEKIQHDLLEIGSALATPHPLPVSGLKSRPAEFEKLIDNMTQKMPELKNFILPGGSRAGSLLHVARTTARKAERRVIALMQKEEIDQGIVIYLNRLSDLFFTMARFVNYLEKKKEIKWIKR